MPVRTQASTGRKFVNRISTRNRVNNWNHIGVANREQLKEYDPVGYELVRTTFKLTPENDWRYTPVRKQPSVMPPPAKFKIDPYYTKFTWAREFPVVGSDKVSDDALLKANDTIRKMFAYRHDILESADQRRAKLVVLGRGESLTDLPELKDAKNEPGFDNVRYFDFTPDKKTMVVPEENVLGEGDPLLGKSMVVSVMAKGLYLETAAREPLPEGRGERQQYEQQLVWTGRGRPIKRLDIEFDLRSGSSKKTQPPRVCGKQHPPPATAPTTGPPACWPISTPPAPVSPPTMPHAPSPPAKPSRSTTPSCTSWSMRRCYIPITSIGGISIDGR